MVNTRRKSETGRPKKISQANGVAENAKAKGHTSHSQTVNVGELNGDGQFGDRVETHGEETGRGGYEEMSGVEESEKETKVDNDDGDLNTYSDNEADLEQNTSEDDEASDQVDQLWEDEEESYEEEEDEEYVDDEDAIKENGGADEDNDEDAIKEKDEDDDVGAKGEDKGEGKVGRYKKIEGGEAKPKEEEAMAKDGKKAMAKDGKKAKGHDSGKVEVGLNNDKNSNKNIRKKAIVVGPKKADFEDKPESSQKGKEKEKEKEKKRVESMGMIFICSSKTKSDCFKYMVLGLPERKKNIVEKIYSGMRLFLYDVDLKLMYGIFKAAGPGGYNIEPKAFKSQFPSQVRFSVLDDCLPIAEENFKKVIKENYYSKGKFDCQLKQEQVKKLCKLFLKSRKRNLPKKLRGTLKFHRAENHKPIAPETSRRQIVTDRKRPALEELRFRERPRKRARRLTPPRQPLPSHTSNRRDQYHSYRDRREFSPVSRDPYRDEPPILIRRDPYLESAASYLHRDRDRDRDMYAYADVRDAYSRRLQDPYTDVVSRSGYGDGRSLYMEQHPVYSVGYGSAYTRDPLLESRDGYRENRGVEYQSSGYRENRGVEYQSSLRREQVLDRGGVNPLSLETSRYRQDVGSRGDYRQLGLYADPIYSAEYVSRVGLAREYRWI